MQGVRGSNPLSSTTWTTDRAAAQPVAGSGDGTRADAVTGSRSRTIAVAALHTMVSRNPARPMPPAALLSLTRVATPPTAATTPRTAETAVSQDGIVAR